MYDVYDLPKSIPLGRQGEQYARAVEIDCAKMLSDYPGARLTLMQRRTRGETARIVKANVSDTGVITWSPDMDAMAVAGLGAIEIVAMVGDKVAKSVIATTAIAPSLTPPDADTRSGWVKDVLDASDAAQGAMIAAQESAAAAAGSASAAQSSANAAAKSENAASKSATGAAGSADAASKSAGDAAQSASDAAASAKAAAGSAADAAGALDNVNASADAAAKAARAAAESAKDASASKSGAAESAMEAAGSASAASKSAGNAAKSASEASGSAAAAEESKTGAESAASAAKSEADKAAASAAAADTSAQAAAGSAAAAAESAQGAADAAKAEAAKIIQDGEIARTSTWSSQKILDQLYREVTASGNPAVIENALEGYPMSVKASWGLIQEGEGEPSPDNVRPIKGRESVKITAGGTEHILALPDTIYGGEVDAVTGKGNANTKTVTVDGDKLKFTESGLYWNLPFKSTPNAGSKAAYATSHFSTKVIGINKTYAFAYATAKEIKPYFATAEELNTYLSNQYAAGTPMQIAYKLAAPESFTATGGGRIDALAGTNTISTDADSVEVKTRTAVAGIIDDTVIAEDKTWSSKNTVDKLLPMQNVTGNPVAIETLEGYPLELSASWEPKQDGSGTPSPDNVKPITGGRDSVTVTRAEDGASRGTTFDKKYYGGVLTGKKLKITREIATISSCNKAQVLNNVVRGEIGLKPLAATAKSGNAISDYLPEKVNYAEDAEGVYTNQSVAYIKINKGRLVSADLAGLNEYLNAHPLTVAYKLMTPQEIEVGSANDLPALAGTNTLSTDADTVTVTAPTPPQTTASAAEAQAAKLDYVAMMADVDVDDLTGVDDASVDSGMDMPTEIEGSETDGKQEV